MSEANNNTNYLDSQSNFTSLNQPGNEQKLATETVSQPITNHSRYLSEDIIPLESFQIKNAKAEESLELKMDWQKIALKLREYNRKLLKNVFRLEQELADIDNKYNKYVEKSQTSDVLVAQQAEEIKTYQEQISQLNQQIDEQEITINDLSQQYELSQQQTVQLEKECSLLQQDYEKQATELAAKGREVKELQTKICQQQRYALQYKAELKRYQEKTTISSVSSPDPVITPKVSYSNNRSIKPWSTSTIRDPKISLPQTAKIEPLQPTPTVQKTEDIAPWSAPLSQQKSEQSTVNSASKAKSQSLAAVDLPSFPRSR
ncbi:hypothetical protein NIES4102_25420 [Chondrocystis sp. NIES-4102]|nr:hypothetical protein NIES4102_25420 [Chondrocystis sp. NIES-4102]